MGSHIFWDFGGRKILAILGGNSVLVGIWGIKKFQKVDP